MKKTTKIWLITAASLMLTGCVIFTVVMSILKWDFTKLSTVKYETNTYELTETFHNLSIASDTSGVKFALSDSDKCKVVCYEEETARHSVTVENGMLVVKLNNQRSWYDYIGLAFGSPTIMVYLPKAQYETLTITESTGNVDIPKDFHFASVDISVTTGGVTCAASASDSMKIKTSTGNIGVENASAGSLTLSAATGGITVSDVKCEGDANIKITTGRTILNNMECQNLISDGSTGNITLNNVKTAQKSSITRSTGDVNFHDSDSGEIYVKTSTGDVTGSLLTDKVFITQTDTGRVNIPKSGAGGNCEILTDTGDILLTIQ